MQPELGLRNRPTQARSQKRLELILDAAGTILEQEGPDALNTNRIARQSGVPVASLYHYFPNKHAVLSALGERWLDRVVAAIDRAEAARPPERGLPDFMDLCLAELADCYRTTAGLEALMRAMSLLPELRAFEAQHDLRAVQRMADLMHRGGVKASAADLLRIADVIVTGSHALLVMCRAKPDREKSAVLVEVQKLWRSYIAALLERGTNPSI